MDEHELRKKFLTVELLKIFHTYYMHFFFSHTNKLLTYTGLVFEGGFKIYSRVGKLRARLSEIYSHHQIAFSVDFTM